MNLNEYFDAFRWCENNSIRCYPKPKGNEFILVYEINGQPKTSGKTYSKKEYDTKWKEFYIYLYKKFKDV